MYGSRFTWGEETETKSCWREAVEGTVSVPEILFHCQSLGRSAQARDVDLVANHLASCMLPMLSLNIAVM